MNDRTTTIVIIALLVWFLSRAKRQRTAATMQPSQTPLPGPPKIQPPKVDGFLPYRELLAKKESSGKYNARRPSSQYWGRYQLGRLARKVGGAQGVRWTQYKNDFALQNKTVKSWTRRLYKELKAQPLAQRAVAAGTLHGLPVSWAFLVAMDHLTGRAATMKWLRTGKPTTDGNGVKNTDFAKPFTAFNLSTLDKEQTS